MPAVFTAEELLAFQLTASRLNLPLSDMLRLVETRQQNTEAPLPLPDGLAPSPTPPLAPPFQAAKSGVSKDSEGAGAGQRTPTVVRDEDGLPAVSQLEVPMSSENIEELLQDPMPQTLHDVTRAETTPRDLSADGPRDMSTMNATGIPPQRYSDSLNTASHTTGTEDPDPLLPASGQDAVGVNSSLVGQPVQQAYNSGTFDQNLHLSQQPSFLSLAPTQLEPPLHSEASLLIHGAQFADDLSTENNDGISDFTPINRAGAGFGESFASNVWGSWDTIIEPWNPKLPEVNTRLLLSSREQPPAIPPGLALATSDHAVSEEGALTTAEIHEKQSQQTRQRRGGRQTALSGPRSGVQKTKMKFDATIAEFRAGRLAACAGCWIQHKRVLTNLP